MIDAFKTNIDHYTSLNGLKNIANNSIITQCGKPRSLYKSNLHLFVSDGDVPDFSLHTELDDNPWVELDLLTAYPIELIVVYNRRFHETKAEQITVHASSNKKIWTQIHSGNLNFGGLAAGIPLILPLAGRDLYRYIRIALPHKGHLHLSKIQIFVADDIYNILRTAHSIVSGSKNGQVPPNSRVGILGTSNSVMRDGYVNSVGNDNLNVVANVSIGSSHPTFVPFRLEDDILSRIDVLLVEISVNQQTAIDAGAYRPELLEEIFLFILTRCAAFNIMPVFLIMPELQSYFGANKTPFASRDMIVSLCRTHSIPYIDAYNLVDAMIEANNISSERRSYERFFKDRNHLTPRYAKIVGATVGAGLSVLRQKSSLRRIKGDAHDFRMALPNVYSPEMLIHRSTQIISLDMLQIKEGETIIFNLDKGDIVTGVVLNMAKCRGSIRIQGKNTTTKNLYNSYFDPARELWLACWSLVAPVVCGDDAIRVSCVGVTLGDHTEPNDHGDRRHDDENEGVFIEIAGLIVMSEIKVHELIAVDAPNLDLVDYLKSIDDYDLAPNV